MSHLSQGSNKYLGLASRRRAMTLKEASVRTSYDFQGVVTWKEEAVRVGESQTSRLSRGSEVFLWFSSRRRDANSKEAAAYSSQGNNG
jgi:hypothetical protein